MVITDIKAHVLDTETPALVTSFDGLFHHSGAAGTIKYTLVRLLTDTELEGNYIVWSEVASGRPPALAEVLRAMKPLVVGEDPLNREKLWYRLGTLWYGEKGSAFAAIDVALWDLAAKAAGLPLWRYLGGYRDRIRAYASGNVPHDEGDIVRIARDLKQRGYTAMKLHPIPIELCPALRDAVGPDVDLIYDAVFAHGRAEALAVGRELERLRYFWYEAPLPPDDIEGYIDLRRRLDVPLTVELIYATQYREFVSRHAVTYLRTLSGIRGGITEMRKVAALCEAFGMSWGAARLRRHPVPGRQPERATGHPQHAAVRTADRSRRGGPLRHRHHRGVAHRRGRLRARPATPGPGPADRLGTGRRRHRTGDLTGRRRHSVTPETMQPVRKVRPPGTISDESGYTVRWKIHASQARVWAAKMRRKPAAEMAATVRCRSVAAQ